jgi:predicted thioesterase
MIELMEWTSVDAVQPALGADQTSVGTHVDVSHESAAREGEHVVFHSRLVEVDRRRLTFEVSAKVDARIIGRGTHQRFVIDLSRFSG